MQDIATPSSDIEMLNTTNIILENTIGTSVPEHGPRIIGLYLCTQADCSVHRQWVLPYLFLNDDCGDRRKMCVLFWVRSAVSAQPGTNGPAQAPTMSATKHIQPGVPQVHRALRGGIRHL